MGTIGKLTLQIYIVIKSICDLYAKILMPSTTKSNNNNNNK